MEAGAQNRELQSILDLVTNLEIDDSQIRDQKIDDELVAWYATRFDMFVEDGVIAAIGMYLNKLNMRKDVNEITRIAIMHEALNRQVSTKED